MSISAMFSSVDQLGSNSTPPLPDPVTALRGALSFSTADEVTTPARTLRGGCYLVRFTPSGSSNHFDGTIRIQRDGVNVLASGDLYQHTTPGPSPEGGVPIFRRDRYAAYLRIRRIAVGVPSSDEVTLEILFYFVNRDTGEWSGGDDIFTALLKWVTAPPDYPRSSDYLNGELRNRSDVVLGAFSMGWVSEHFRRAVIEIDRVKGEPSPGDNGDEIGWGEVYRRVGWDVRVESGPDDIENTDDGVWSIAELHQAMREHRVPDADLDAEWRYHVLVVPKIQSDWILWGYMYDTNGGDDSDGPREGVAVAAQAEFPDDPDKFPEFQPVKGKPLKDLSSAFFRTAVHETGHAQGLLHRFTDFNGFMKPTHDVAKSPGTFPHNIEKAFAQVSARRLRHLPDPWVRPGGLDWNSITDASGSIPILLGDFADGPDSLELEIEPFDGAPVPLGAPVRIDLALFNSVESSGGTSVPADCLSFKSGHIRGYVIDPAGTAREFRSLIQCSGACEPEILEGGRGRAKRHSLTLLRGPQGALFRSPGLHRVIVQTCWHDDKEVLRGAKGDTTVMIDSARDPDHVRVARNILSSRQALSVLVLGASKEDAPEGFQCILECLGNDVLRPHYNVVHARWFEMERRRKKGPLSETENDRLAKLNKRLREEETIMTDSEARRLLKFDVISSETKTYLRSILEKRSKSRNLSTTAPPVPQGSGNS